VLVRAGGRLDQSVVIGPGVFSSTLQTDSIHLLSLPPDSPSTPGEWQNYCTRSTADGSTRDARHAGWAVATTAIALTTLSPLQTSASDSLVSFRGELPPRLFLWPRPRRDDWLRRPRSYSTPAFGGRR
jgi:hypothetical protein